jgi:hypothetical protein
MNRRLASVLMVLLLLLCIQLLCYAQWYQGPSGGTGGQPFDHGKASGGGKDLMTVSFLQDGSIRCISVLYRDVKSAGQPLQLKNGFCDPGPGSLSFNGGAGVSLAPDEYIIGISGRYGDHIESIRIYTNKKTYPPFGGTGGRFEFGYTAPQGQMIAGFFGRAGTNLDAIGVLYAPCTAQKTPCR